MHAQSHTLTREFSFTDKDFQFLAALCGERTGIVLAAQKKDMVYGRLARRLRMLGLDSFSQYCDYLRSPGGQDEMGNLVNAITTNLTSFFRESHHFDHLRAMLSDMAKKDEAGRLRLWSAGCSSGMEPYSMAMVLNKVMPANGKWDARILATDIDTNMLDVGSAGEYTSKDVESVPPEFSREVDPSRPGFVRMSAALRERVSFRHLNLLDPWPFKGQMDAVFCRNVVIYFDKPTKQALFERLSGKIKPGGYLYIGHSENLNGISSRFELIGRTIYRRLP